MNKGNKNKPGLLCVISSPSGGGKTTVIRAVRQQHPEYGYSISATTRERRNRESHGVDYYFLTDREFDRYIEKGEFIEWANVHSFRYGTLKKPVEKLLSAGKVVLLDLDVVGGINVRKTFPNQSLLIFLAPPSLEELQRRLQGRKSEGPAQIQERLARIPFEMKYAEEYDVQIVNRYLKKTVKRVAEEIQKAIVKLEA
ncbi:MAG TPA: guanylate kinase [Bacteroidetes bacterium]|nr:guanylate kinase [Bacteroidota bacterium]